jgi:MSP (Major sperm protein) domain
MEACPRPCRKRAHIERSRELKRALLAAVCTVVLTVVVSVGIVVLNGVQSSNSRPAQMLDMTTGSMRCVMVTVTTCSVTITNASSSRDPLTWKVKESVPAHASISSSAGTLQPGESSQIQVVFPASSACPYTAIFSLTRPSVGPDGDFSLTQHCP